MWPVVGLISSRQVPNAFRYAGMMRMVPVYPLSKLAIHAAKDTHSDTRSMAAVEFALIAGAREALFKGGELIMRSFSDSPSVDRIVRCRGELQYDQFEYDWCLNAIFPEGPTFANSIYASLQVSTSLYIPTTRHTYPEHHQECSPFGPNQSDLKFLKMADNLLLLTCEIPRSFILDIGQFTAGCVSCG